MKLGSPKISAYMKLGSPKISASNLKWFQKYWYSKLDPFYNFLKKGLEK